MEIQQYFADAHNNHFIPLKAAAFILKCSDNIGFFGKIIKDFARYHFDTCECLCFQGEANMQDLVQRKIVLFTPNKKYSGKIDLKSDDMRTIDQLNSSTIYWKNPAEKSFDDAIQLYDVDISIQGAGKLSSFKKLQIRLSDIIFFSDSLQKTGTSSEKQRAKTLSVKSKDDVATIRLLTEMRGDSFYYIQGTFHGLFKNKTKQRYFPLTGARVYEVIRTGDKWERFEINIGNDFIGISSNHIEACSFSDSEG